MGNLWGKCRFKLCATIDILCSWKLKAFSSGSSLNRFLGDGDDVERGGFPSGRTNSVSEACFYFLLLCWCISSLSWFPQVMLIILKNTTHFKGCGANVAYFKNRNVNTPNK